MEWPLYGSRDWAAFVKRETHSCPGSQLKPHQRVIARFLDVSSPYRGLLVVHSIGAGKTLSAIGVVANSAAAARPAAWVIAPASLKNNFSAELVKPQAVAEFECGSWARGATGRWTRDPAGTPFHELQSADAAEVSALVAASVADSVAYMSLNGLTDRAMTALENARTNPFDGRVVVVDECHVLIRAVTNSDGSAEPSLSRRLYDMLMAARRCKLVLLSGTPLINFPRELAYAVNLVAGPLAQHSVRWKRPLTAAELVRAKAALAGCPKILSVSRADVAGAVFEIAPDGFEAAARKGSVRACERGTDAVKRAIAPFAGPDAALQSRAFELLPPATFDETFIDAVKASVVRETTLMRRMRGRISFFSAADRSLYPSTTHRTLKLPMSDTQYAVYAAAREMERDLELKNLYKRKDGEDDVTVHRSYSRAACNFVFPKTDPKVFRAAVRAALRDSGAPGAQLEQEYARQVAANIARVKNSSLWKSDAALREHSPKFAAVLKGLVDSRGCAMVYSSFRSVEGLGLLANLLEKRGWRRVEVARTDGKDRRFEVGRGKGPAFILPPLGTEDGEDLLRLFNGDKLSARMEASAKKLFGDDLDNRRGAIVKAVMLSPSGGTGINLKCVRSVHILEPHWHSTQLDQVAGRAVRMGSHASLPPEERNVAINVYVVTFSDLQRAAPEFKVMKDADDGLTSDEVLLDISARKERVLGGLLRLMSRAAIDCALWGKDCYEPPAIFGDVVPIPPDIREDVQDPVAKTARFRVAVPGGDVVVHVRQRKVFDASGELVGRVVKSADGEDEVAWIGTPPRPA